MFLFCVLNTYNIYKKKKYCRVNLTYNTTNYLFKISYWNTKTRCENYLSLKTKILERCLWRCSRVFIVTCEHISLFVLIAGFEQTNVCWAYIEKSRLLTTDQVSMRYFEVFMRKQNLLIIWTYISTTLRVS